jgi:hypothetical protein
LALCIQHLPVEAVIIHPLGDSRAQTASRTALVTLIAVSNTDGLQAPYLNQKTPGLRVSSKTMKLSYPYTARFGDCHWLFREL